LGRYIRLISGKLGEPEVERREAAIELQLTNRLAITRNSHPREVLRVRYFRAVSAMLGVACFAPNLSQSAEYTAQEEVNLSIIETEQLLEFALSPTCCDSVSSDLLTANEVGELDRVSAIQFETKPSK
jgi:hypothetical protein